MDNSGKKGMKCPLPYLNLLVWLLGATFVFPQNLIPNPGFENFTDCPSRLGNFHDDVQNWTTPTQGSTDYFNNCSVAMGTPKNFNGEQMADFGVGYAGLYFYAPDDYREYIQVELLEPLKRGRSYSLSFYVSLAERSDFAIKEFGVLFARASLNVPIRKVLSKMHLYRQQDNAYHFMEIGYTNFYKDTEDWILVNTRFIATGLERVMIIGNFDDNARTRKFKTKRGAKQGAYYYIDNLELIATKAKADDSTGNPGAETPLATAFELDKTHTFRDVLFDFDKHVLLDQAKADLQQLHRFLEVNPQLVITVNGHTDNVGPQEYNDTLSANRCKAVTNYLIELGLEQSRIRWKSFGGRNPIADNTSENGRKRNRRVEFVISREVDN